MNPLSIYAKKGKKINDNYHLGQLNGPVSQTDIQRNMVGFVVDGHILCDRPRENHA